MTSNPNIQAAEGSGDARDAGRKTILIVDDQAVLRKILEHVLVQRGYQVLTAVNGLEAIRTIVGCAGKIDVLITDLMMPVMGGVELLEYAAVLRPEMKLISLSAAVSLVSLDLRVLSLPKPFSLQAIVGSVMEVLAVAVPGSAKNAGKAREGSRRRAASPPRSPSQGF